MKSSKRPGLIKAIGWFKLDRFTYIYRQISYISRDLVGKTIVDHPDVVQIRRCSKYIFSFDLTPGFVGLGKVDCKTRLETLKSQLFLLSGLNHHTCINTVLLGRIAAARKADGGCDRHCDVINDVPFPLYLTLMTSNVRYASIFSGS